jgi:HNH endonuclease
MTNIVRAPFPFNAYGADADSNVYNASGQLMKGSYLPSGYRMYGFTQADGTPKHMSGHRFTYLCFFPDYPKDHQIHHKNQIRHDNRIENLVDLSVADHAKETARQNPGRWTKSIATRSKPVIKESLLDGSTVEFDSVKAAAEDAGIKPCDMAIIIETETELNDCLWSLKDGVLPGENWYTITHDSVEEWHPAAIKDLQGLQVSQYGRVCINGRFTFGSLSEGGDYVMCYNRRLRRVAAAVCLAFHGPPPSPDYCQVRRINKEGNNNAATNLMWASNTNMRGTAWAEPTSMRKRMTKNESKEFASTFMSSLPLQIVHTGQGVETKGVWLHQVLEVANQLIDADNISLVYTTFSFSEKVSSFSMLRKLVKHSLCLDIKRRDPKTDRKWYNFCIMVPGHDRPT